MAVGHRIVTSHLVLRPLLALLALVGLASASCAEAPAAASHPRHPLTEPRAGAIIARVFHDAGLEPEPDRYLPVAGHERRLRVEVAAAGRRFGVAYVTNDDANVFGDVLPAHPKDDALAVASVDGNRVLVLFAGDYVEDDLAGEDHDKTTIAADRRLARDVRDFLHRAEQQGWP